MTRTGFTSLATVTARHASVLPLRGIQQNAAIPSPGGAPMVDSRGKDAKRPATNADEETFELDY